MAIIDIIKNTKEFYPGSNVIAIIRERTEDLRIETLKTKTLKITSETEKQRIDRWSKEAVPMPTDCRIALEKLGAKFGVTLIQTTEKIGYVLGR